MEIIAKIWLFIIFIITKVDFILMVAFAIQKKMGILTASWWWLLVIFIVINVINWFLIWINKLVVKLL